MLLVSSGMLLLHFVPCCVVRPLASSPNGLPLSSRTRVPCKVSSSRSLTSSPTLARMPSPGPWVSLTAEFPWEWKELVSEFRYFSSTPITAHRLVLAFQCTGEAPPDSHPIPLCPAETVLICFKHSCIQLTPDEGAWASQRSSPLCRHGSLSCMWP